MLVSDVIQLIQDCVSTASDLTNRSVKPLFSNGRICRQLKFALDKYALFTKGIEDYYSLPVGQNTPSILLPDDAIRSEAIRFIVWFINGYAYPINTTNLNNTWGNFPVPLQGLPRSANIWKDRINFYPQNSSGFNTCILSNNIGATDTVITVNNKSTGVFGTSGFPAKNGRLTINNEIIEYQYIQNGSFYGCSRGVEETTASPHTAGIAINENNVWVYYYRLHFPIVADSTTDIIPNDVLNTQMLVSDDHMETIVKYTAYNLLSIIDVQKAASFKVDFEEWLKQAKYDIYKGRSIISKSSNIRDPFEFETNSPIWRV